MKKDLCYDKSRNGIYLKVKTIPGASSDKVHGLVGNRVKLFVRAAPRNGEANRATAALVAKFFGLKKSCCVVTSGHKSSGKIVFIEADVENAIKTAFYGVKPDENNA
ncbi:MAG: DUF167 domain-containing protein [Holosporaceae bacterium]|jgi:uncharacterized protein YggU (UPF0235/DUF167 family)|nr:DUF167 domain-containing protein [Holosporaceae bacterium]